MDTELIIEKLKENFNSDILEIAVKNQKRMIITIKPDSILNVADYLYQDRRIQVYYCICIAYKKRI